MLTPPLQRRGQVSKEEEKESRKKEKQPPQVPPSPLGPKAPPLGWPVVDGRRETGRGSSACRRANQGNCYGSVVCVFATRRTRQMWDTRNATAPLASGTGLLGREGSSERETRHEAWLVLRPGRLAAAHAVLCVCSCRYLSYRRHTARQRLTQPLKQSSPVLPVLCALHSSFSSFLNQQHTTAPLDRSIMHPLPSRRGPGAERWED